MTKAIRKFLEKESIEASAPCRIDMGGTLDLSTFYYPLRYLSPCTLNMAIDLRTRIRLFPNSSDQVKVSSKGFESAEFPLDSAPFKHPLGLILAVAAYFRAEGVHILIESSSPPRSALGGSSAAAVALVAAFSRILEQLGIQRAFSKRQVALLAHGLEASVAAVPCGLQDQLAAVFGGIHAWYWQSAAEESPFTKKAVLPRAFWGQFEKHLLVAYCGVPHESKDINGMWVEQFLDGNFRDRWAEIIRCTLGVIQAISEKNFVAAADLMNQETEIRRIMTPDVLDEIGEKLVDAAVELRCGARFTGAGGGGCIWALGEAADIDQLKGRWKELLAARKEASLLRAKIDGHGLKVDSKDVP